MFEGEDLLDGDLSARGFVECGDDSSICTLAEGMQELVVGT